MGDRRTASGRFTVLVEDVPASGQVVNVIRATSTAGPIQILVRAPDDAPLSPFLAEPFGVREGGLGRQSSAWRVHDHDETAPCTATTRVLDADVAELIDDRNQTRFPLLERVMVEADH